MERDHGDGDGGSDDDGDDDDDDDLRFCMTRRLARTRAAVVAVAFAVDCYHCFLMARRDHVGAEQSCSS
jgi:hypothetical protein